MTVTLDLAFKTIASIASILVIISTLIKGYRSIRKGRKERLDKLRRLYSGNWNNQGQIKNKPSHYIDLDEWGNGNQFVGRFNVRKGDDEHSWEMFDISCKRRFQKLKCEIFKMEDENKIVIALGTLKKSKNSLHWILKESVTDQFPAEALLRRGLPKVA